MDKITLLKRNSLKKPKPYASYVRDKYYCLDFGVKMKIKRQKQAKKTLSFYKYNFNFREPFQILIDGTFCQAALKNKIQIKEQLPKYLMGEIQLCTTK